MDKDEAVQKLSTVGRISMSYAEDLYDSFFPKPVVKQCVADWYEGNKGNFEAELLYVLTDISNVVGDDYSDFELWLSNQQNNPFQTLVNMHQFGYEVEKEPRYTVRLKGLTSKRSYLNYLIEDDRWYLNDEVSSVAARTQHTRKELEDADFGWVFDCPGVEVKEVE